MWFTVGADASLYRHFVFESGVLKSIVVRRSGENISFEVDGVDEVVPEGWIASLALILVVRHEEPLSAARAWVNSHILCPIVIISKWSLMANSLRYIVLNRRHPLLQMFSPLFEMLLPPSLEFIKWWPFSKFTSVLLLLGLLPLLLAHLAWLGAVLRSQNLVNDWAIWSYLDVINFVDLWSHLAQEFWCFA